MRQRRRRLPVLLLACLLPWLASGAAPPQDASRDAENKLQQAREELKNVAQERRRLEDARGQAAQQLRDADENVARSGRALADTEAAIGQQQQALAQLQQQQTGLETRLDAQRRQLAALLYGAYQLGDHAPLKLLLSQDSVASANRNLVNLRYLQHGRARAVASLTGDLQALSATRQQIVERNQALEQARARQRQQASALAQDRRQRAQALAELDQRYQDRSAREKALGADVRSLERLLADLRAAAARAQARADNAPSAPGKTPPRVIANAPPLKVGGLGWPLAGDLLARYGGRLPDGHTSNGVLIGAPAGSTVTAVADGTVVFSDWMTGYGMILIIDHGNGYMSLYAHNDTLLRDAGAHVRRGEALAKVGNSGGQGVTALYFELRHDGQPVDPASWLQRQ